jgi:DNA-binding CsgD family transcriptional regulator
VKLQAIFTLAFISTIQFLSAQSTELDPEKWAVELSKKDYTANENVRELRQIFAATDSAHTFQFIEALEKNGKSRGDHFKARFNCIKAGAIYLKNIYYEFYQDRKPVNLDLIRKQMTELYTSAMDIAYRSEDDYLVAFVSYDYASTIIVIGDIGISVMYGKNGIDLYEKLSVPVLPERYQVLAELLYRVREYDECIKYAKKAVTAWQSSPKEYKPFTVSCMNTVALGYHRQKIYDSALIYYNQALQLAKKINDTVWAGIVSGNIGQVFYAQGKFDTAYALLKADYNASKAKGYFDNAGNSLQWAARTNLALGNRATALAEVREAFQLLRQWPDANYLRNAYYTATQIFREMGNYDSAFYYNNLWSRINDSLEKVIATSSLAISKAKLNDETSRYNVQNLNKEKRSQLLLRNIIIASIVVLSFFVVLIINGQRLKEKLKTEKAEQEIISAKEQLEMFTANLVEKTNLIEKLEMQVKYKHASSEQQAIISELSRQTILTGEDWLKFKMLFEKTHPGFFTKLKEQVSDITLAEQRMAALTRLHLTTKQMAAVLGISPNSVIKAKQRLRQRFNFQTDFHVEEFLARL